MLLHCTNRGFKIGTYYVGLRDLYQGSDIIAQIKSKRLRWTGHIKRREVDSMLRTVSESVPQGGRQLGRPRLRWGDQVLKDMTKLHATPEMMEDRDEWRRVVGEAKNLLRFEWPNR
uniref:Uncharacterized protein n=1 Tax=Cuerna arida TaxID=1464854 RepID=A0A1B6FJX7_9HEMI